MNETATPKTWFERISQALLGEPQDAEQLIDILRDAEARQLLSNDTLAMLEAVVGFAQLQVRDIMIPRRQMVAVHSQDAFDEVLPRIVQSGHSRFPAFDHEDKEVIGILHAKDCLRYTLEPETFTMQNVLRPAKVVPESKRLDDLLKDFRQSRNHMAIVVDEYGSVSGFVTIEDVIEQIVGDIEDEFDIDEDAFVKKHTNGDHIVKAHMPLSEFNQYFNTAYDTGEFDTIGGFVVHHFGYLPKHSDIVDIESLSFEVLLADNRRVRLLKIVQPELT